MAIEIHRVEPEPVHVAVEPEFHDGKRPVLNFGIVEVEIRLLAQEIVEIELLPSRLPLPGGPAVEDRQPVVRRSAVGLGIRPDVPVGLRVVPALPAFFEERMQIAGMRKHLVNDHAQPGFMRGVYELVEIVQRAEQGIDAGMVGDVVSHVQHGRGEERREPDRVDAEIRDVGQSSRDAFQVADAVAIVILKRAGVNLVYDASAPPFVF